MWTINFIDVYGNKRSIHDLPFDTATGIAAGIIEVGGNVTSLVNLGA